MPHYDGYQGHCSGGPSKGTLKLRDIIKAKWPVVNVGYPFGIYNCRPPSEHAEGRACDVGLSASNPSHLVVAERICDWAVENAEKYGIQSVIWNRRVWGFGRWTWRDYHGASAHTDHVHIGQNLWGAKGLWPDEQEDDLTPEQDARLRAIEEKLDKIFIGDFSKDPAAAKLATGRGNSIINLVDRIKNDVKAIRAHIVPPPPEPEPTEPTP